MSTLNSIPILFLLAISGLAHSACGLSIDNSSRAPGQDLITQEVIEQLVGTWVEDNVGFVHFLAGLGIIPESQVHQAVALAEKESRENPPKPWIIFRSDGMFTWDTKSPPVRFIPESVNSIPT